MDIEIIRVVAYFGWKKMFGSLTQSLLDSQVEAHQEAAPQEGSVAQTQAHDNHSQDAVVSLIHEPSSLHSVASGFLINEFRNNCLRLMGYKPPVPSFVAKRVVTPFAFSPFLKLSSGRKCVLRAGQNRHHDTVALERAMAISQVHDNQRQNAIVPLS